jgi:peptidyl-prolyl cis-trans isomerase D
MAVITKIRNKYAKFAGGIIALALVGFILMDAASGGLRDLFGNDQSIAKVNGVEIDAKEYSQRVKDYEILYAYGQQGQPVDDNTRAQINAEALRDLVNEKLIRKECEKLGIMSTKEEEKELIYGGNPDPIVQQYQPFKNPNTGMFDPQYVKAFEQQIDQYDPSGKSREQWETIKAYILRTNLIKKYNAAVSKSLYAPAFILTQQKKEGNVFAKINYVKIPYATVDDKQVTVSDQEIKDYMKAHESQYTINEASRSIEYVAFDVIPTTEDTLRTMETFNNVKNEFATATDVENIVNRNSDEQYNGVYINKSSLMSMYADSIFSLPVNAVFGPYYENGSYKLTKVLDRKSMPDSVKCRHILVKTAQQGQPTNTDTAAKQKLDSAIAAIKSGAPFADVVAKYSEDEGSKNTAGEYTFTLQQKVTISKEFGDFIFDGKPGETKTVKVENSQYAGYHYIEILDQKGIQPSLKIATISKALYAGENTESAVYAKATEFAGKNADKKAFDNAIKAGNLNKRVGENIKEYDFTINGIGPSREIVRWIYESKVGDVSSVFQLDGRYVVAKVSSIQEPGLMALDANIRQSIEPVVRAKKKGEIIASKYKGMTTLDAIAGASGQQVQVLDSFNSTMQYIMNLGYEPKVVGYSFYDGFKANTMSPAIKGVDGVFFTTLVSRGEAPVKTDPSMDIQRKLMMESNMRNVASNSFMETMRKQAKITYNPKNF